MHDLLVYHGSGTLARLPAWWEDIDDDPRWQDSVFIALAVAYGTLAVVALVQVKLFLLLGLVPRLPAPVIARLISFHLLRESVCLQLFRIQARTVAFGWTTQKVFHLLNALVCILRCVVFALRDRVSIFGSASGIAQTLAWLSQHAQPE